MEKPDPKILLVWIGRIGDLLVSTPFISGLRQKYPEADITLLLREYTRETGEAVPGVNRVITLPSVKRPASFLEFLSGYAFRKFDLCLDLNAAYSRTSGMLCLMSGAKRRVSFEKFRAEKFYTETAPRPDDKAHFSDRYRLLAGHFGFDCGNQMRLAPAPQARTKADEKAREFDITTTSFNVCVHPGNFRKREHRWPEDNFIALTKLLLAEPDVRVFYFSGPGEDAHVIKMLKSLPAGRITLIKAMNPAVWAALMTRFDIMIVNATATMHIAAAMDVPFLGFHSGYSWRCWRPLTGLCDNINSGDWDSCRIIPVEMAHQKYAALKTQILARK